MKTCQLDENIGFQSQQPTKSLLAHGMSMQPHTNYNK